MSVVVAKHLPAILFAAIATLVLLPTGGTHAAPIFAVELDFGDIDVRSDEPISRSSEFNSPIVQGNFLTRSAFASAERGLLRASAHGNIFYPDMRAVGSGTVRANTDAIAAFRLDDVIITGPADSVQAALNLHLSGGVGANAFARNLDGTGNEAVAGASVTVNIVVNGFRFGGTQGRGATWDVATGLGQNSLFEDGIFVNFDGDEEIKSAILTLPVDQPFSLTMAINVSEESEVRSSGSGLDPVERKAEGNASFASTLSFPLIGPVFDLPEGFTVNSVAGLIEDNRWLGAPAVDITEPPAFALGASALLGIALLRRRLSGAFATVSPPS